MSKLDWNWGSKSKKVKTSAKVSSKKTITSSKKSKKLVLKNTKAGKAAAKKALLQSFPNLAAKKPSAPKSSSLDWNWGAKKKEAQQKRGKVAPTISPKKLLKKPLNGFTKIQRAVSDANNKLKNKLPQEKLKLGIPGFDALFRQGIPHGASILVEGGPGSGKTIFCLQTAINAAQKGLKVLYMSFEEPEDRLRQHMRNFGWDPEKYEKSGKLMIRRFNALDIARSVEALLSEAKRELLIDIQPVLIPKEFIPNIVCIDSLSSISSAFSGEESRFRIYMEQLFRYLEGHGMTSFLIRETANPTHIGKIYVEHGEAVSFLSDGIIVWYNVIYENGKRERAIEVLKMRGEEFDRKIVKAEIVNKKGIIVHPDQQLQGSYGLT